jgi:uncharacterized protein
VVKTGEVVKVQVMDVDIKRNRIALSMRLTDEVERKTTKAINTVASKKSHTGQKNRQVKNTTAPSGTMAQAFANLKK